MRALLASVTAVALAVAIAAGVVAASEHLSTGTTRSAVRHDNAAAQEAIVRQADIAHQLDDLGRQTTAIQLAISSASGSARTIDLDFGTMARARDAIIDLLNRSLTTATLSPSERAEFSHAFDELQGLQIAIENAGWDLATAGGKLQP